MVRKLSVDESFIVSEGPTAEEASGITRVKGKCAKDGTEGWLTIKGNAGSVYLKPNDKLFTVRKEVAFTQKMASDSEEIRTISVGETVECLEGPKEDKVPPINRAKIRAIDGAVGWATVRQDNVKAWDSRSPYKTLKAAPLYTTREGRDVLREMIVGEALDLVEGPVEVDGSMWLKGRVRKDGAIGWARFANEGEELIGN